MNIIYEIEDNYIDLSNLNYVSIILSSRTENGRYLYYFRFTVATFTWDSNMNFDKIEVRKLRNNLIEAWKDYKESK